MSNVEQIKKDNEKPINKAGKARLQSIIQDITRTNWTFIDDYEFTFSNPNPGFDLSDFIYKSPDNEGAANVMAKSIISVDIPVLTAPEIDTVSGGERRIGVRMHEMFRFSAKFRDSESLGLRRYFMKIWAAQQYEYFDDIKSTVVITNNEVEVFRSNNIIITGVSPVQFSSDNTQIAEFDVQFISNVYGDVDLTDFGHSKYIDKFARPER